MVLIDMGENLVWYVIIIVLFVCIGGMLVFQLQTKRAHSFVELAYSAPPAKLAKQGSAYTIAFQAMIHGDEKVLRAYTVLIDDVPVLWRQITLEPGKLVSVTESILLSAEPKNSTVLVEVRLDGRSIGTWVNLV